MKKILLISAMLVSLTSCSEDEGDRSGWEKFSTFFAETRSNTGAYNVEAAGWNVRVVEWVPKDNSNIRCVFAAGTEKAGAACYEVK